jgi:CheY-like chemotaxis protein
LAARILIIDDDQSLRRSLVRLLRVHEYEVVEGESAPDALRLARATKPAVIVIDLLMPGRSGVEAAMDLKADADTAGIPIIALTASQLPAELDRALFADTLRKPCPPDALLKAIARAQHPAQPGDES